MLPFLIAISLTAYIVWWYLRPKLIGLPPEPTLSIPLIGHLLAFDAKKPQDTIYQWYKTVGPIFTVRMGSKVTVMVCDWETIKEILQNRGEEFAHRPKQPLSDMLRVGNFGIADTSGELWTEQRRFSLSVLRHFGFGRPLMEEKILSQVDKLLSQISHEFMAGDKVELDMEEMLKFCIGNIMSSLLFGESFDFGDEKFRELNEAMDKSFASFIGLNALVLDSYPILAKLPFFGGFGFKAMKDIEEFLRQYYRDVFSKRKSLLKRESEAENFVDAYLKEMELRQKSGNLSYFSENQLTEVIADLWVAGLETTITTLRWAILYMITYPEVQNRVREEIHKVIGISGVPKMSDKLQLPFTAATLLETQRICNTADSTLPHTVIKDTKLGGYNIPAGTTILPVSYTVHMDPKMFPEPNVFKPERFLEADGKVTTKLVGFLPFGMGKRVCLGEGMAKTEMFLIFTSLIQKFKFSVVEGCEKPSLEPVRSFTLIPQKYKCCVEKCDG